MRFSFRLQPLLDVARAKEDCAQAILARVERERSVTHAGIRRARGRLIEVDTMVHRQIQSATVEQELRPFFHYRRLVEKGLAAGVATGQRLAQEAFEKRAVLSEASKKRRVLDRLRERRKEQFIATVRALETREIDDLASMSFARRADRRADDPVARREYSGVATTPSSRFSTLCVTAR